MVHIITPLFQSHGYIS